MVVKNYLHTLQIKGLSVRFGGLADAAHLAFAAQVKADFVSVEDRFLKRARRIKLSIWLGTPVQLCERENLR